MSKHDERSRSSDTTAAADRTRTAQTSDPTNPLETTHAGAQANLASSQANLNARSTEGDDAIRARSEAAFNDAKRRGENETDDQAGTRVAALTRIVEILQPLDRDTRSRIMSDVGRALGH